MSNDTMSGDPLVIDLPDGYNPNDDGGLRIVEMFLDWELPPTNILIDVRDGKYFALVEGGTRDPVVEDVA